MWGWFCDLVWLWFYLPSFYASFGDILSLISMTSIIIYLYEIWTTCPISKTTILRQWSFFKGWHCGRIAYYFTNVRCVSQVYIGWQWLYRGIIIFNLPNDKCCKHLPSCHGFQSPLHLHITIL